MLSWGDSTYHVLWPLWPLCSVADMDFRLWPIWFLVVADTVLLCMMADIVVVDMVAPQRTYCRISLHHLIGRRPGSVVKKTA